MTSSQLKVEYTEGVMKKNVQIDTNTWVVHIIGIENCVLLHGFKRKIDAEIAKKFLDSLLIDWTEPPSVVIQRLKVLGYNTRQELMNEACKHLQW